MQPTKNWCDPEALAAQRKLDCQCEVIRLLNAAQSLLTGWVLKEDSEEIEALFNPIYEKLDRD